MSDSPIPPDPLGAHLEKQRWRQFFCPPPYWPTPAVGPDDQRAALLAGDGFLSRGRPSREADGIAWNFKNGQGRVLRLEVPWPPTWGGPALPEYSPTAGHLDEPSVVAHRYAGLLRARARHADLGVDSVAVGFGAVAIFVALVALAATLSTDPNHDVALMILTYAVLALAVVVLIVSLIGSRQSHDAPWLHALADAWDQEAARLAAVAQKRDEVA